MDNKQSREEKTEGFQLNLDLDSEIPDYVPVEVDLETKTEETPLETLEEQENESVAAEEQETVKQSRKQHKTLKRLVYTTVVLAISVFLAYFFIIFAIDFFGFNQSDKLVDIEIPAGASTKQIADILYENNIKGQPFCFRVYSKLTGADGKYQKGAFSLSADMDYSTIIEKLQTSTPRETVRVTIPEGFTVDKIGKLLEEKEVCTKKDFELAVISDEYDYDFVKAIPTANDGEEYKGRIYLLEGYLFPDTYEFYVGSSATTVVTRMLDNFNNRLSAELRAEIARQGMTIDEAITLASVVQGEAGKPDDMLGVSRVLSNRLQPGSGFAKLECDATRDYVSQCLPSIGGVVVTTSAYNTYERTGLPVGAINNPGLQAIEAALYPSDKDEHKSAYFFATDYDTETTYFTKTLSEHERICRKYGIGMYG